MKKKHALFLSFFLYLLIIVFWFGCYKIESNVTSALTKSNILIYIIGVCAYTFLLFLGVFIHTRLEKSINYKREFSCVPEKIQVLICFFVFICLTALVVKWLVFDEFHEEGVSNGAYFFFPKIINISLYILLFIIIIFYIVYKKDIYIPTLYAIYFGSVIISFFGEFVPNPFSSWGGGILNISSVTESIYNVVDLVPYTNESTSIYGHYALFFLLPIKILGVSTFSIGLLLGITGAIEQIALIYVINCCSIKKWIKAVITLAAINRSTYRYFAISPIRTMWPIIVCAWFVYSYRNEDKIKIGWTGYVISSLAILWNLETGVACLLCVFSFQMLYAMSKNNNKRILFWADSVINGMILLCSLITPLLIVNIYNFLCGYKKIEIKSFFYPYLGGDFVNSEISCMVPFGNHLWIYVLAILMTCFGYALCHFLFERVDIHGFVLLFSISELGIALFSYYFNEAHWGCLDIERKVCAIIVALIFERTSYLLEEKTEDFGLRLSKFCLLFILLIIGWMSSAVVLSDPVRISSMNMSGVFERATIKSDIDILVNNIPCNIYGVGQGVKAIYHEVGWKNTSHFKDTGALFNIDKETNYEIQIEEILRNEEFLVGNSSFFDKELIKNVLERNESYKLMGEYSVGDYLYSYYSSK